MEIELKNRRDRKRTSRTVRSKMVDLSIYINTRVCIYVSVIILHINRLKASVKR